jgi:hypothetical protein
MNESREIRIPMPGSGVLIDYASQAERDRSLWLAEARQELAHRGCFLPPWSALTDAERQLAAVGARNWLRAAATAGLVGDLRPAVLVGNCDLTASEIATILGALAAAAECKEYRAGLNCDACAAHPAELCDDHEADLEAVAEYRKLAARIAEATR